MAFFAVGVPRELRCNADGHSITHLTFWEEEQLLAVLTSSSVQIWDGGQVGGFWAARERPTGAQCVCLTPALAAPREAGRAGTQRRVPGS
jgi:hypothetical protein